MRLISSSSVIEIESVLSVWALDNYLDDKGFVYGCGNYLPGKHYDRLGEAYRLGELRGVVGLTIVEESLDMYPANMREAMGRILAFTPHIFCTDSLSAEWLLHYGCNAEVGGHPAWLCSANKTEKILKNVDSLTAISGLDKNLLIKEKGEIIGAVSYGDLGMAIASAILQIPCVMYVSGSRSIRAEFRRWHPLVRFAQKFGCEENIAFEKKDALNKITKIEKLNIVSEKDIENQKRLARNTLEKISLSKKSKNNSIDSVLEGALGKAKEMKSQIEGPRELVIGEVFDPRTHYDNDYYANGNGLVYTKPDGMKELYKGPARDWNGLDKIAEIMWEIVPKDLHATGLLSLGCGYGYDVLRFSKKGWDCYGVDISEDAISNSPKEIKNRVICADILKSETINKLPRKKFGVITTFDFWEHIWHEDINDLIKATMPLLSPGGIMINIICTRGETEEDWEIEKGTKFSKENSWLLASGHVTIKRWIWWAKTFLNCGYELRNDLAHLMQVLITEDSMLSRVMSWRPRNLLIVGKSENA